MGLEQGGLRSCYYLGIKALTALAETTAIADFRGLTVFSAIYVVIAFENKLKARLSIQATTALAETTAIADFRSLTIFSAIYVVYSTLVSIKTTEIMLNQKLLAPGLEVA